MLHQKWIIFHIDMYEGRLLMVPRQSSTNIINDALDNRNSNNCKVSFGVIKVYCNNEIVIITYNLYPYIRVKYDIFSQKQYPIV